MTTVCVTYNTLSATPLEVLCEYELAFQRQKAVASTIHHQLYSATKISFAVSAKPMPVQTSECFISNFSTFRMEGSKEAYRREKCVLRSPCSHKNVSTKAPPLCAAAGASPVPTMKGCAILSCADSPERGPRCKGVRVCQ